MVTVVVSHESCPQAHAVGLSGRPLAMSVPAVLAEPLPATVPGVYPETKPSVAPEQAGMILSHVTPDGQLGLGLGLGLGESHVTPDGQHPL